MFRSGLGSLDTVSSAATATKYILEDPGLPAIASRINTLHSLEQPSSGGGSTPGIGLSRLVRPLDLYIWHRRHTYTSILLAISLVAGIATIGYAMAKL